METVGQPSESAAVVMSGSTDLDRRRHRGRSRPEAWTVDLLAYAAGVIDSDGSISIGVEKAGMRARRLVRGPSYREKVTLRQIEPEAVDLLHQSFGGSRFVYIPRRERAQPLHSWQVSDRMASAFLSAIAPYLRIKRRQAELCVELRRLKDEIGKGAAHTMRSHDGGSARRHAMGLLRGEVRRLNRVEGRAERYASGAIREAVRTDPPVGLAAYAAGVIDSDGSIGIRRKTYAIRVLRTTCQPTFSEHVTIRQLESEAVDLFREHFGGCRSVITDTRGEWKRQPLQSLVLVDRKAAFLLSAVLPHLRIKRARRSFVSSCGV